MKSKLVFYWDGNKQEFDIRYSDPNGKRRGIFKVKDLNKEVKGEKQYHWSKAILPSEWEKEMKNYGKKQN